MKRFTLLIIFHFLLVIFSVALAREDSVLIVHTSDTHSLIEPFPANHTDTTKAGKGGYLRRLALVDELRRSNSNKVFLFDCGDFSQGSVYYNVYRGELEVKLMNLMRYDACAIGNHEFDYGLENLAHLARTAEFPFVCCNYDFRGTPCEGLIKPYIVIERSGVRLGVFGVSPQPEGLILKRNMKGVRYTSPAKAAKSVIKHLRKKEGCDVIVCLSHLGLGEQKDMDIDFVRNTSGIDVLLGGHSHVLLPQPLYLLDRKGDEVIVMHEGKYGCSVGTLQIRLSQTE